MPTCALAWPCHHPLSQALKVVPVPKHMEEGSPAAFYMPPSLDGSRDGVFYANLGDVSAQFKYAITLTPTLTRQRLGAVQVCDRRDPPLARAQTLRSLEHHVFAPSL